MIKESIMLFCTKTQYSSILSYKGKGGEGDLSIRGIRWEIIEIS